LASVSHAVGGEALERVPPNTRLKLTARVVGGRIAFVTMKAWRRSLGAVR